MLEGPTNRKGSLHEDVKGMMIDKRTKRLVPLQIERRASGHKNDIQVMQTGTHFRAMSKGTGETSCLLDVLTMALRDLVAWFMMITEDESVLMSSGRDYCADPWGRVE